MKNVFLILLVSLLSVSAFPVNNKVEPDTSKLIVLEYPDSLDELVGLFKGKVIYIDLMASWCKPCISEIQEANGLYELFEDNNIVSIYVTVDARDDFEKCHSLLVKHGAKGYLVPYLPPQKGMVSLFSSDIDNLFLRDENGEMDIAFPRYAIVNKQGQIVSKRAKRPSDRESLIKELTEWL